MIRLRDASAAVREGVPPVLTDVFALVTELGGVGFIVVLLSVLYWVDDRESTGTVIGYTLVGLAVVLTLKEGLGMPRPPAEVRAVAVEPGSHGFPSGHAIAATVVYGGLLLARDLLRDYRYAVPTAALIVLIGLSRVVIGVHYVGDVLVGHAVGLVVLAGLWATVGHRAHLACGLAAAVSLVGLGVTSGGTNALLALGGSIGGAVAFWYTEGEEFPHPAGPLGTALFVGGGLAFAGGTYYLATAVPFAPVAVAVNAVLVGGIVLLPALLRTEALAPLAVRQSGSS